jgi:choloylglycine hydrolase
MWLNGTSYPEADDRPALNELQWIQYQLDNFATVDEVLANLRKIRIGRQGVAPLHYLIADASGNAATIEFIQGRTVVHTGKDLKEPVLTNTIYADALKQYESKDRGYDNSNERFAIACKMTKEFQQAKTTQPPVAFAFKVLDQIAQGDYTKWRIVYDITDRKIHFIANGNERKMISFSSIKFDCSENALAYHLHTKDNGSSITFKSLNLDANRKLIETSARESSNQLHIPLPMIAEASRYFTKVFCVP